MSDALEPETAEADLKIAEADLSGTAHLARAALGSPDPPPGAEAASLSRVEARMREAALSPRPLRASTSLAPPRPWWSRLRFWRK